MSSDLQISIFSFFAYLSIKNGHCIVPQFFHKNRALGKWVAKQREQYRFYKEGRHSFLTDERIDLLKSINFTWQIKGRGAQKDHADKSKSEDTKENNYSEVREGEDAKAEVPKAFPHDIAPLPKMCERSLTDSSMIDCKPPALSSLFASHVTTQQQWQQQQQLFNERQKLQQRAASMAAFKTPASTHQAHSSLTNSQAMADIAAALASVPPVGDSFDTAPAGIRAAFTGNRRGSYHVNDSDRRFSSLL